jgi:hypothetical protein
MWLTAVILVTAVAILAIIGLVGPLVWTVTIGIFTLVGLIRWAATERAGQNGGDTDQ